MWVLRLTFVSGSLHCWRVTFIRDARPTVLRKIVVQDPTGFNIDPALAMELRDAKRRYDFVYTTQISQPEHYEREGAILRARIKEIEKDLQCPCPSMYGKDERKRDEERLKELLQVRHSGLKLSMQEDIEEAWLTARVASWSTIPECAAAARLRELDARRWDDPWIRFAAHSQRAIRISNSRSIICEP